MYKRHAARIREHYREKMHYAIEVCARVFGSGIHYTCPSSGVFITIRLPQYVKASALQDRLLQRSISVTNVDQHLLPENQRNDRIRLCIIGVEKPRIEAGNDRDRGGNTAFRAADEVEGMADQSWAAA
ncbi:Uncharacterised protein [Actinobacillus pleuropneumoniae]|nr:Uncharacterised protein [Actinobacillus pleuropneumoniae]